MTISVDHTLESLGHRTVNDGVARDFLVHNRDVCRSCSHQYISRDSSGHLTIGVLQGPTANVFTVRVQVEGVSSLSLS